MEHSPSWEAYSSSACQEIIRILWKPKVHYCNHKRSPTVPILSQSSPVHESPSKFLKVKFNIILPSKPRSPKWSLSIISPNPKPVCASPFPHSARLLSFLFFLIWSPEQYLVTDIGHNLKLLFMWFSPLHLYLPPLKLKHTSHRNACILPQIARRLPSYHTVQNSTFTVFLLSKFNPPS